MLHCLQCGSQQFHSTNGNKYTCNSCAFTLYLNASWAAAVVLRDPVHNYLRTIRNHEPYKWRLDTAWWFIDPNETAEEAARRECKEELGIEIGSLTYLWSFSGQYERCEITRPIINFVFESTITKEQIATFALNDEIIGVERHTLDSLPKDLLAENIKWILPLLLK